MVDRYLAAPEGQLITVRVIKIKKKLFGGLKYFVSYKQTKMDGSTELYTVNKLSWIDELYEETNGNIRPAEILELK